MNEIKKLIDSCMKDIKINDNTIENVIRRSESRSKYTDVNSFKRTIKYVIPILIILTGTTAAASYIRNTWYASINSVELPEMDAMEIIKINDDVQKQEDINLIFSSLSELEDYLGIKLLHSPYAQDDGLYRVIYQKIGVGYNEVTVSAYISGDTGNIIYRDDKTRYYSWENGYLYKQPSDLTIYFISDPAQDNIGKEYLGIYSFVENFVSEQGYSVNVLKMDTDAYASCELDIDAYIAVFAADGIQYELSLRSTMDELKKLINSFEY